MSIKHKIILTYTKDLSVEIPDVQTLLLARERISKYKITLDQVKEAYPTIRWGGRGG